MSKITEFCIFAITPDDVDRIKGLLRSVDVTVGELVTYRCIDLRADEVDGQTLQVLTDCASKFDELF
jgi:hypothetical protein